MDNFIGGLLMSLLSSNTIRGYRGLYKIDSVEEVVSKNVLPFSTKDLSFYVLSLTKGNV